ncbi:hypothetical protein CASFOL_010726 [Castilleja foliolosa]|uniref:BHLH domain-containing protein n=1 Tax=Castilleja foliolosa TaxID=1961234 RepID=A0ABD3DTF7_9LAMI
MALEALSSSELLNFIMYDSNLTTPFTYNNNNNNDSSELELAGSCSSMPPPPPPETANPPAAQPPRKKRRRRPKVCKNKEEAETQRMTHIAVERNRRKQMNDHLAVLRSLMPETYVQRGDQASIVGGAIEFVKELEHILQSLEAKKYALLKQENIENDDDDTKQVLDTPFAQFFTHPQFSSSHSQLGNNKSIADIEVTLIETHANIRILSHRRVRHLSKIVASFHSILLTILHLNVTTLDELVLYSISAKVEEGCRFNTADDVAGAVYHMLRIIEDEAILGFQS